MALCSIHAQLHPVVAHEKFVSFQNKMNDSALGFMVPESNKLTINQLNHVGWGLVVRALVLRLSFLVKDPGAKSSVLVTAIQILRDRSFITSWGGGGGNFLPCTKSEGGKILRHTKGTN